jgi:tape measure domain-containing protein
MAEDIEVLVTELRVDMKRYEAAMRRQARLSADSATKVEKRYQQMNRKITASTNQMSRDVRRAIAAIALGAAGREVINYTDAWIDHNNKIKAAGEVSGIQGRALLSLASDARTARSEIEPYVDLYSRILRASGDLAESEAEVAKVTQLTAKAFAAGGASASEQAAGVLQLGQALGSGFLQGDELRSLRENAPLVAKAIADAMGVSIGELKTLGAEGKLTSDVVFKAMIKAEDQIESAFGVTTPRASDAAKLAFDGLKLKVGEYLTESGQVADASQAMAEAINFVANNVEAFADAVVIGGAALTGALGAQAGLAALSSLNGIAVGATNAAKAMAILRAASAFILGPAGIIIGVAALAAAFAAVAIDAGRTADEFEEVRKSATVAGSALKQFSDATTPTELQQQATDLSKIKEEYYGIAAAAITAAEAEKQRRVESLLQERQNVASGLDKLEARRSNRNFDRAGNSGKAAALDRDIGLARDLLDEYDAAIARAANASIPSIADQLAAMDGGGSGGGGSSAERGALDELNKAYRDAFESEREQIARLRDERLSAIEASGKSESEKAELRSKANAIYKAELADIRDAEAAMFDDYVDKLLDADQVRRETTQAEKDAIAELMNARDEMAGRTLTIAEREYAARRDAIEAEIADETRKAEALKILEEERAEYTRQIREELLGEGEHSNSEAEVVRAQQEAALEALREGLELKLITKEEFAERELEIAAETEEKLKEIRAASMQVQLANGEQLFGGLAGMAKAFAGEQSGVYKALFAVEKAFAVASAIVNIQHGVARAMSLPFPANLGAAATVAGLGASVVANLQGASANFADGGVDIRGPGTGRSDSIPANISRGESVITAAGTAANKGILAAINAGVPVEASIANARSLSSVSIGPTQLVVQGDIGTAETLANLQAQLAARDAILADNVNRIVKRQRVSTTARHKR